MHLLDFYLDNIQEEQYIEEVSPLLVGLSAASLTVAAFNAYKQYLTKAARTCKNLPPREKGVCMWNFKFQGKKKELQILKGSISKCNKTKDPKQCMLKLKEKAIKISQQVQFIAGRMKELRKQRYE